MIHGHSANVAARRVASRDGRTTNRRGRVVVVVEFEFEGEFEGEGEGEGVDDEDARDARGV